MRRSLDTDIHTVQDLCANASGIFGGSFDAGEARDAFLEKRRPAYQGR
jgi:1,4-dihydroxy-2-naphthoyl-CoA synthase